MGVGRKATDQRTPCRKFLQHEMDYTCLVSKCLRSYGLLCLGVYRLLDDVLDDNEERTLTQKRYVITHPPTDFRLIDSDRVITCIVLYNYRACLLYTSDAAEE